MNTTLLKIYSRSTSTRVNMICLIGFLIGMSMSYGSFYHKKLKDPSIPWYGFFLKIPMQTSWDKATPFNS